MFRQLTFDSFSYIVSAESKRERQKGGRMAALWQVSKGQSRVVVAIPSWGIAIKFARIRSKVVTAYFQDVSYYTREMYPNPDPAVRALFWETMTLASRRCIRQTFGGIIDNWNERSLYKHTNTLHRLVLQPTYLSVCGLVNIQRYGKPGDVSESESIFYAFYRIAGQALVHDSHHWIKAANFHLTPDGPKLLDYGSEETQKIVSNHGVAFYRDFDIEFGRAEAERYRIALVNSA